MMRRTSTNRGIRTTQTGFTFVELLLVTVIVGLLAALLIPAFLGQREKAEGASAQSLLRAGAGTLEAAAIDTDGYAAITTARLREIEPTVTWQTTAGATTAANAISVTGLDASGYTLTTTTPSGQVYAYVKDTGSAPAVARTCGPDCTW
jgi:type IV pilus assembly protein PilA